MISVLRILREIDFCAFTRPNLSKVTHIFPSNQLLNLLPSLAEYILHSLLRLLSSVHAQLCHFSLQQSVELDIYSGRQCSLNVLLEQRQRLLSDRQHNKLKHTLLDLIDLLSREVELALNLLQFNIDLYSRQVVKCLF